MLVSKRLSLGSWLERRLSGLHTAAPRTGGAPPVWGAQGLTPLAISMYKETVKCYLCLEPKVSPMS